MALLELHKTMMVQASGKVPTILQGLMAWLAGGLVGRVTWCTRLIGRPTSIHLGAPGQPERFAGHSFRSTFDLDGMPHHYKFTNLLDKTFTYGRRTVRQWSQVDSIMAWETVQRVLP